VFFGQHGNRLSTGVDLRADVNGSGTVALGYGYEDDSGTAKTGTANITYASIPGFLYITDLRGDVTSCAVSGVDGSVSSCGIAATGFSAPGAPTGIAFSGNWAYVDTGRGSNRRRCLPGKPRQHFRHLHERSYV
jgi:hypothetical protein